MKRVIWTPTARKSLKKTSGFVLELWNEKVLDEFLNQLNSRINQIQQYPELAPKFEDSQIRSLVIHKSITLFYLNSADHIRLLLVWDNRQDPAKLYQQLSG